MFNFNYFVLEESEPCVILVGISFLAFEGRAEDVFQLDIENRIHLVLAC